MMHNLASIQQRALANKTTMTLITTTLVFSLLTSCASNTNSSSQVIERQGAVTLKGKTVTLVGTELKVGQKAPDFTLVAPVELVDSMPEAKEVKLSDSLNKVRFISVVPSLDTPVCDLQTQRFEQEASQYKDVVFYTVSMDLPFAQARYCGARNISQSHVLSDYRDASFGTAYGVLIKEYRLDTRAIFIVGKDDNIKYVEYVKEITNPPDYDSALKALDALVGAHTPISSSATTGIKIGDLAPDFQLSNLAGETVSLSSFRGKPVLLNFWVTWCPHCRAERPMIQEVYNTWREKGLVVLTVDLIGVGSNETTTNLANFMQTNNYTFPVLLDADGQVRKQYDINATPTNFLIDKDGVIREIMVGEFSSKSELEKRLNSLFP